MKNTSINDRCLSSSKRIAALAYSLAIILAVTGCLIILRSATTESKAVEATLSAPSLTAAIPVQSQTSTFYLHGSGPVDNPPTLFLNTTAPTATTEKYKDSTSITRTGGNLWKEVGTWTAAPAMTAGTLASLNDLHVWLGLKNSDDQGTYFDLRVEAYKNSTLVASGQSLCITGVTRNPASAKEVVLAFAPFSAATFNGTSDALNLKVLTRVGTNAAGASCGGHSNAVGLRLYFDAVARPSRFSVTQGADTTPPVLTVGEPTENSITAATQVNVTGTFSDQSPTTIVVNGVTSTLQGNNFSATVPVTEGPNSLLITATDAAGNATAVTRHVVGDTTAPTIAISQPAEGAITNNTQVTVTGTFSDATATTIKVNGIAATVSGNNFSAVVSLNEGSNAIQAVAIDAAQNTSEASRGVILDTALPDLLVEQPLEGSFIQADNVTVTGSIADATAVSVNVNGVSSTIAAGRFTSTLPLNPGSNVLNVLAVDAAGNQIGVSLTVKRVTDTTPPALTLTSPASGAVLAENIVTVSGTAIDDLPVTLSANGVSIRVGPTGEFTGLLHVPFGTNQVTVVAEDAVGNRTQLVRSLTIDGTPPVISDVTPENGAMVNSQAATVRGRITDDTLVSVTVNGLAANVAPDKTFEAGNVPLMEGVNNLVIVAIDQAGNRSNNNLLLIGGDVTPPPPPTFFPIKSATRLTFQTLEGRAEPGSKVKILGGAEPVTADAAFGSGLFAAHVNLAAGSNTLTASAEDAAGNASSAMTLVITSNPNAPTPPAGEPYQINISTGSEQRGLNGAEFPRPLIAVVTDVQGNPVPNALVTFTTVQGAGRFIDGNPSFQVSSDADGHASSRYVSGNTDDVYLIRADFSGNLSTPAVFVEESAQGGNAITTVSGVVLDQNLRALPNVLVRIGGQQTRSAADGRFRVSNVPAGPHQLLELIGRDQIPFPGRWPNITYDFDVLAGVDNNLGRPLFLPQVNGGVSLPLDNNNIVTQDTIVELPIADGSPPIRVTALAGTHVSFPPDVTDKRLSITRIATNRVPMVLEEGRATNLYISVQPSGALFDQPLRISFPNLDGQSPNAAVLLMSFDHDAGRYVQVGTGHVSANGQTVVSDPGSGIRVGAWHALPPPPPQPEVTVLGHIQVANNPAFKDRAILDAEAWVEGARAMLLTTGEEADVWNFRATYSVPPNSAGLARMEASVNAATIDVLPDVQTVDANGNPVAKSGPEATTGLPQLASLSARYQKSRFDHAAARSRLIKRDSDASGLAFQEELPTYYGGTTDEYSDHFDVGLDPQKLAGFIVRKFDWRVSGPGADTYHPPTPSPDAIRWRFGKVNPYPGIIEIKCVMTVKSRGARFPSTVVQSGTLRVQIGVTTDDVTVIGWINPDGVSVTGEGMDSIMLAYYPLDGGASMSLAQKGLTFGHLTRLLTDGPVHPIYPRFMNPAERRHVLNWAFKFSGNFCSKNRCPPTSFGSNEAISAFRQQQGGSFKLFNRYQVKYLVENGRFKLDPLAIRLEVEIGTTHDPLFDVGAQGDAGPANERHVNLDNTTYLINDGTPALPGVLALNVLMSPLKWNHIGDRIEFGIQYGALKRIYNQVYPTYYVFDNRVLTETRPQAPEPSANFNRNPYPPGPAPFVP